MSIDRLKRHEFWKQLLEKSKDKTGLFLNVTPAVDRGWISAGAGKTGFTYVYIITANQAGIQLNINTGSKERNKQIFDSFYQNKQEFETDFGEPLDWQRRESTVQSRIEKIVMEKGIMDMDSWSTIQDKMVDAMVRLEKAMDKHWAKEFARVLVKYAKEWVEDLKRKKEEEKV